MLNELRAVGLAKTPNDGLEGTFLQVNTLQLSWYREMYGSVVRNRLEVSSNYTPRILSCMWHKLNFESLPNFPRKVVYHLLKLFKLFTFQSMFERATQDSDLINIKASSKYLYVW